MFLLHWPHQIMQFSSRNSAVPDEFMCNAGIPFWDYARALEQRRASGCRVVLICPMLCARTGQITEASRCNAVHGRTFWGTCRASLDFCQPLLHRYSVNFVAAKLSSAWRLRMNSSPSYECQHASSTKDMAALDFVQTQATRFAWHASWPISRGGGESKACTDPATPPSSAGDQSRSSCPGFVHRHRGWCLGAQCFQMPQRGLPGRRALSDRKDWQT